jgi:glutamine synthetase
MNKKEILQYVKNHPSGKVKIAFTDIDGILRGKYMSSEKFLSVIEAGMTFCNVIFRVAYRLPGCTGCIGYKYI